MNILSHPLTSYAPFLCCQLQTKTAFRQLLLDEAGVHVEDALLEAIFAATDEDGNGLLDATELATYVHEIRPSSQRERRKYVALSCLLYPPFYLSFFCLNASLVSASKLVHALQRYGWCA